MDVFNGFRTLERAAPPSAAVGEARALQDKVRLEIEGEVKTAQLALRTRRERVGVTEKSLAAAERPSASWASSTRAGHATARATWEASRPADAVRAPSTARYDVRRAEGRMRRRGILEVGRMR